MKKSFKTYHILLLGTLLSAAVSACTQAPIPEDGGEHTCVLRLEGDVVPFDGGTKATGTFSPSESNRLYVRMEGASGAVLGVAQYNQTTGNWNFTYNGTLGGATQGKAHAVLIEKNIWSESTHHLTLRYNTPIYEDAAASFSVTGDGLVLSATLAPKAGRISFAHHLEAGRSRYYEKISGISYYAAFNLSDFSFTEEDLSLYPESFWLQGGDEGYIYGFFTDEEDPTVMLIQDEHYYCRHLPATIFQPGQSGYVENPDTDMTGWRRYSRIQSVWVDGRIFEMRFVPGGSFRMGNDQDDTAAPAHDVSLMHYYIGMYEVTNAQWRQVMEGVSYGDSYPVANQPYDQIQSFIATLNEKTGYRFRLPTEAEWEFAARGSIFSKGYSYSGGNVLNDVAVTSGQRAFASKIPNELGLYDMSGNVAELCLDWYGPYSSDAQFRPGGPASGDYRVVRGGACFDPDAYYTVWHRATTEEYSLAGGSVGFRLVMEVPVIDK